MQGDPLYRAGTNARRRNRVLLARNRAAAIHCPSISFDGYVADSQRNVPGVSISCPLSFRGVEENRAEFHNFDL